VQTAWNAHPKVKTDDIKKERSPRLRIYSHYADHPHVHREAVGREKYQTKTVWEKKGIRTRGKPEYEKGRGTSTFLKISVMYISGTDEDAEARGGKKLRVEKQASLTAR